MRKCSEGLVPPSEATPREVLDLSVIDRLPVLRCNARTLHVFKHGPGAAHFIRNALSKALLPYYPLAGRLHSTQGHLNIYCSGEGVWFVDAAATCDLHSVGYFDDATSIPYHKLLPPPPPENLHLDPLVLMQVLFISTFFPFALTACCPTTYPFGFLSLQQQYSL